MIIVLNGAAATGKGTLANMLAHELGLPHYDLGLIFRAIARVHNGGGWPIVENSVRQKKLLLEGSDVFLSGTPITTELRSEFAALRAAILAATDETLIVRYSKQFVSHSEFIADGRTASQIFPEADLHFHLICCENEARSRRGAEDADVATFLLRRDVDSARVQRNKNAIIIDTTGFTPLESLQEILGQVRKWQERHR